MAEGPESAGRSPLIDTDEPELLCPHCDYSLKGLPEEICPECGHAFDRDQLLYWATARDIPIRNWLVSQETPGGSSLFMMSLFSPSKLGQLIPPRPDRLEIFKYGMLMRILCVLPIGFVVSLLDQNPAALFIMLAALPGVMAGSFLCEWLTGYVLTKSVKPLGVAPTYVRGFWRSLCHCFAGYLMVWSLALCIVVIVGKSWRPYGNPAAGILMGLIIPFSPVVWWWHSLGQAIRRRGVPSVARTVVPIAIFIVAAGSFAVGVITSMALAAVCASAM